MKITQRIQLLKSIVLCGILISVFLSKNLWFGPRHFPKAPVFSNLPSLVGYYDYINIIVLVTLILIALFNNKKIWLFLLIIWQAYLIIDDQNRLQPWFFNYSLILFVLLFFKNRLDESNNYHSVFITLQLLVAFVYIFSGLQKINPFFVNDTFTWLIEPLNTLLSKRQLSIITQFGFVIPYFELLLGIGILIKPIRFIVIPLVITMHILILVLLGPYGKSYNYVVWPWNIVMIALVLTLFTNVKSERFFDFTILFKTSYFYIILIIMVVLPVLSFDNKYDSYLSSSLYSGNTHDAKIYLNKNTYSKLPLYVKHFCETNDSIYVLNIKRWAITELGAPCIPEKRVFLNAYNFIYKTTNAQKNEVQFNFIERNKILGFSD